MKLVIPFDFKPANCIYFSDEVNKSGVWQTFLVGKHLESINKLA